MAIRNFFKKYKAFSISLAAIVLVVPFQNCGGKFEAYHNGLSNLSSQSQGNQGDPGGSNFGFMPAKASGLRPLTLREYNSSVKSLLGDTSNVALQVLPEENFAPFDNFIENSEMSAAKVQGFEAAAQELTKSFLANSTRLKNYLPCVPTSNKDTTCFRNIVNKLGLRAFRRPLTTAESDKFVAVISSFATSSGTYQGGLKVFLNVILQHPMFLYRWEVGQLSSTSGVYQLNDFELASRLSFTLFGLPPDDELLTDATAKRLTNPTSFKVIVERMLKDPRAMAHIDFFHASWLGYQAIDDSTAISKAMREESRALIKRVVIDENRPWTDIFKSRETFVTKALAQHYGLPVPATDNVWIQYPDLKRGGLLSHGTFLSIGAKFGDTSPIQRGYHIRKQLFCEKISPPPPGIDVDSPPKGETTTSPCKQANHFASTLQSGTSCISCHSRMDPIGFGLERFNSAGQFRTTEPFYPECAISGDGSAAPYGIFNGPGELGELIVRSGQAEGCMVERWMQLSLGVQNQDKQEDLTAKYLSSFKKSERMLDMIKSFVLDDDFRHRKTLESQ